MCYERQVKSEYTIQLCEEPREDGERTLVGYNPASAEAAAAELLRRGLLRRELGDYDPAGVLRQRTYGASRVGSVRHARTSERARGCKRAYTRSSSHTSTDVHSTRAHASGQARTLRMSRLGCFSCCDC